MDFKSSTEEKKLEKQKLELFETYQSLPQIVFWLVFLCFIAWGIVDSLLISGGYSKVYGSFRLPSRGLTWLLWGVIGLVVAGISSFLTNVRTSVHILEIIYLRRLLSSKKGHVEELPSEETEEDELLPERYCVNCKRIYRASACPCCNKSSGRHLKRSELSLLVKTDGTWAKTLKDALKENGIPFLSEKSEEEGGEMLFDLWILSKDLKRANKLTEVIFSEKAEESEE